MSEIFDAFQRPIWHRLKISTRLSRGFPKQQKQLALLTDLNMTHFYRDTQQICQIKVNLIEVIRLWNFKKKGKKSMAYVLYIPKRLSGKH